MTRSEYLLTCVVVAEYVLLQEYVQLQEELRSRVGERLQEVVQFEGRVLGRLC